MLPNFELPGPLPLHIHPQARRAALTLTFGTATVLLTHLQLVELSTAAALRCDLTLYETPAVNVQQISQPGRQFVNFTYRPKEGQAFRFSCHAQALTQQFSAAYEALVPFLDPLVFPGPTKLFFDPYTEQLTLELEGEQWALPSIAHLTFQPGEYATLLRAPSKLLTLHCTDDTFQLRADWTPNTHIFPLNATQEQWRAAQAWQQRFQPGQDYPAF